MSYKNGFFFLAFCHCAQLTYNIPTFFFTDQSFIFGIWNLNMMVIPIFVFEINSNIKTLIVSNAKYFRFEFKLLSAILSQFRFAPSVIQNVNQIFPRFSIKRFFKVWITIFGTKSPTWILEKKTYIRVHKKIHSCHVKMKKINFLKINSSLLRLLLSHSIQKTFKKIFI